MQRDTHRHLREPIDVYCVVNFSTYTYNAYTYLVDLGLFGVNHVLSHGSRCFWCKPEDETTETDLIVSLAAQATRSTRNDLFSNHEVADIDSMMSCGPVAECHYMSTKFMAWCYG
jgi:hypothetical protein